jgi:hypothetical protein
MMYGLTTTYILGILWWLKYPGGEFFFMDDLFWGVIWGFRVRFIADSSEDPVKKPENEVLN